MAAGISARLGSPKQLLMHKGKTLLRHSIDEAVNSDGDYVVVVVGANAASYLNEIDESTVSVVENKEWEKGMSSSIIAGLKSLLKQEEKLDGVILMVCDQPFVSTSVLNELLGKYKETGKHIIASNYEGIIGPPVLFHHSFFDSLMKLKGDEGAKKLIKEHTDQVDTISFPLGRIDIDKKEDYESLAEYLANDKPNLNENK